MVFQWNFITFSNQYLRKLLQWLWVEKKLFLTLSSRTRYNGSIILRSGDCSGYGRYLITLWCSSNHDFTFFALCIAAILSWNMALPGIRMVAIVSILSLRMSRYLSTIKSDEKSKRKPVNFRLNHYWSTFMFDGWDYAIWIVGFTRCSPDTNTPVP